jgi:hypothetical protein
VPVELLRVERIDSWDSNASSHNVWLVRGWTVEEEPRLLTVRTLNAWNASLCKQSMDTKQLVWIGWKAGRYGARDMVTAKLDDTKFQHDEASQ